MPAPIDYTAGFVDPTQSLMQTLQMGNMLGQMGDRRDARIAEQDAQAAADIAAQQKEARNAEIKALYDTALKNPTAENFQKLASYYPPEQQEAIRKGYTMLDDAAQKRLVNDSMDVFIAFDSGQPDIAISRMEEKVVGYKNAGNEKAAKDMQTLVGLAKTGTKGIEGVAGMLGTNIALMDKDAMDGYAKYKESKREDYKLIADELKAKLEAERPEGTKIDESARKMMNTAVESAMSSDLLASQASNLADEFERAKPPGGYPAGALEAWKKMVGGQDQFTRLKQEYVKLRNTDVLKNLPPGVASDKDIEIALSAFPDESANPSQITAFLRGTAKLQQYSSAVNKAKAEWVNQNGSLGPAQVTFKAGGQDVKKGMAFWDFTKNIPVPNVIGKAATAGTPVEVDY